MLWLSLQLLLLEMWVLSFEWNQDDGHEELKLIFEVSLEEKRDEIIKWEALGRGTISRLHKKPLCCRVAIHIV